MPRHADAHARARRLRRSRVKSGTATRALPGSPASCPAMACSTSAASSTVRVSGPTWSQLAENGMTPAAPDQSERRLETDDAAQPRGRTHRAAGVGAQRIGGETAGDGRARSGARAARVVRGVPRVARGRPRQVERRPAVRELVRCLLAEQHAARLVQPRDDERIAIRDVLGEHLRMRGGADAARLEHVLESERECRAAGRAPFRRRARPAAIRACARACSAVTVM